MAMRDVSHGYDLCHIHWHVFLIINFMTEKTKIGHMGVSILFSFIYMTAYVFCIFFGASIGVVYLLFSGSPFVILWMVFYILKDKHEPEKTFDEYFYQEEDVRRTT